LKLWEQGASQGGILNALHALLAISNGRGGGDYIDGHAAFVGRWGGDRVAVVGDYTETGDLPATDYAEYIYAACRASQGSEYTEDELGPFSVDDWTDISSEAERFLSAQWQLRFTGDGWVTREAVGNSVFGERTGAMMRPDLLIGGTNPEDVTGTLRTLVEQAESSGRPLLGAALRLAESIDEAQTSGFPS
jgi:hypothetical protein